MLASHADDSAAGARATDARDRPFDRDTELAGLRAVVSCLEALGIADAELEELKGLIDELEAQGEGDAARERFARARALALLLDDRLPIPVLRARFKKELLPFDTWLRYLGLIADHADRPSRWDRIEFIATRIFSSDGPDGLLVPLPRGEMTSGLARISGLRVAREDRREAAIGFLGNAARHITSFASVQDLFDSGFYQDVQAYKATLKSERLDPGILSSLILLNLAITNHLVRCERARAEEAARRQAEAAERARAEAAPAEAELDVDVDEDAPRAMAPLPGEASAGEAGAAFDEPREEAPAVGAPSSEHLERRIDALRVAPSLYRALGLEPPLLEELERLAADLSVGLDELAALPAGVPDREARRQSVVAQVDEAERVFLEIDDGIPPSVFEERAQRHLLPEEDWFLYARLLYEHATTTARRDRIERLVVLLITRPLEDGQLELLSDSECLMAIARIAPEPLTDEARRESVMHFLTDTAQRLGQMTSVAEVLESGLYVDLQGYKVALRRERLDPGILYALALTKVALNNHLVSFAVDEGIPPAEIARRIAQKDEEVARVFREDEEVERRARRSRRETAKSPESPPREKASVPVVAPARGGRRLRRVALLAALAASVAAYLVIIPRARNELTELSEQDLAAVGEFLESGAISRGRDQRVFLGRVLASRWLLMSPEERRAAAEELREGLLRRNVTSALVFHEQDLAVQIDRSQVILVE